SLPGLKTDRQNVVQMSNFIGSAGYGLAMRGAVAEATPLLEQAASNGDGSYWNLWATAELVLLGRDSAKSLQIFQQTYRRYKQPASARAAASLLFALGQSEAGWAAVRELVPGGNSFASYRAAIVGMRMGAFDDDARLKWRLEVQAGVPKDNFGQATLVSDFANAALFQTT